MASTASGRVGEVGAKRHGPHQKPRAHRVAYELEGRVTEVVKGGIQTAGSSFLVSHGGKKSRLREDCLEH